VGGYCEDSARVEAEATDEKTLLILWKYCQADC